MSLLGGIGAITSQLRQYECGEYFLDLTGNELTSDNAKAIKNRKEYVEEKIDNYRRSSR